MLISFNISTKHQPQSQITIRTTINITFFRRIALLTLGIFFIAACDDLIDPPIITHPEHEPYTEVWEICMYLTDGSLFHRLALTFYPNEKYFHVEQFPHLYTWYPFGHDYNLHYDIRNDTMYLRFPEEEYFDYERNYAKFFVTMLPPDTMEMVYIGGGPMYGIKCRFTRSN